MKWFRFYSEVIDDAKVASMSDKTFRIWVLAMCHAGELDRDGNVPVTVTELAWRIRESEEAVSVAIKQLEELDIIETKNGKRRFKNWQKRQWKSDDSRDRVKRFRNGHVTVTVTPPDTDTDTEKQHMSSSFESKEIFIYWKQVMKHPRAVLDAKRKRKIEARLQEGRSLEDCRLAIDGCKLSAWHMGANDRGKVFDDIELIFRDAEHFERFMNQKPDEDPYENFPRIGGTDGKKD